MSCNVCIEVYVPDYYKTVAHMNTHNTKDHFGVQLHFIIKLHIYMYVNYNCYIRQRQNEEFAKI